MKRTSTKAIVIHTTAGNSNNTFQNVMDWFLKILKWNKGGYHYIYEQSGKEYIAYDALKDEATNGILPNWGLDLHNYNTIHLSYIGGINNANANEAVCNISPAQERAMIERVKLLLKTYPDAKVIGHNQINTMRFCPSFWTPDWLRKYDIPERNIESIDPFKLKDKIKSLPHPKDFYLKVGNKNVCPNCGKIL